MPRKVGQRMMWSPNFGAIQVGSLKAFSGTEMQAETMTHYPHQMLSFFISYGKKNSSRNRQKALFLLNGFANLR